MVGQQFHRMSMLAQFGQNLRGNIEAGLKVTGLDIAKAEQTRQQVFHRFLEMFERYDVLMTPAAPVRPYPVALNFPNEINGRTFENYVDWISPTFLITLVSLPVEACQPARPRMDCQSDCKLSRLGLKRHAS